MILENKYKKIYINIRWRNIYKKKTCKKAAALHDEPYLTEGMLFKSAKGASVTYFV